MTDNPLMRALGQSRDDANQAARGAAARRQSAGLEGEVSRWIVFGSAPDCDVHLEHESVSPRHCRVGQLADGRFVVEDLGSRTGTVVRRPGQTGSGDRVVGRLPLYRDMALRIGDLEERWSDHF